MKLKALFSAAIGAEFLSSMAAAAELRVSHQFSSTDVRHKVAQMVADHVKDANLDLQASVLAIY